MEESILYYLIGLHVNHHGPYETGGLRGEDGVVVKAEIRVMCFEDE